MQRRTSSSYLIPALIGANLFLTAFWGCSLIVDGNFIEPVDAGYNCTGIVNGAICPGSEEESSRLICLFGECVESACGDGFVDEEAGEECEEDKDVCDLSTCLFHCWEDADCKQEHPCLPPECIQHSCVARPAPGARCSSDGVDFGVCTPSHECESMECSSDADCVGDDECTSGLCEDQRCVANFGALCELEDGAPGMCGEGFVCLPSLDAES